MRRSLLRHRLVGPSARVLLMVGRLSEVHKGFDTAIAAMQAIRREVPDARLVIAGPGDQSALRAAAAAVQDAVVIAGLLERSDLLRLLPELRSVPHAGPPPSASRRRASASCTWKPRALASRSSPGEPGDSEAVVDGETGLVVNGESPAEVAGAVIRLLTDRPYAERLGECGRARVHREFDGRLRRRQFAALVDDLLAPESSIA